MFLHEWCVQPYNVWWLLLPVLPSNPISAIAQQYIYSISMSNAAAFVALLERLNVASNEIRSAAEAEYELMKQNPDSRLALLLMTVHSRLYQMCDISLL